MSGFEALIEDVRHALQEPSAAPTHTHGADGVAASADKSDLTARFVQELEKVSARCFSAYAEVAAWEQVAKVAVGPLPVWQQRVRIADTRPVAVADGITIDAEKLRKQLESRGISTFRPGLTAEIDRSEFQRRLAKCGVGVVEADYAIASTGTLVVTATAARPRSFSLVPEVSVVLVRRNRVVIDLATSLSMLGAERVRNSPVVLITGPSRTADIEKRIVLGVHGPRDLLVILLPPQ